MRKQVCIVVPRNKGMEMVTERPRDVTMARVPPRVKTHETPYCWLNSSDVPVALQTSTRLQVAKNEAT